MSKYRVLAVDLDGTLLNDESLIEESTKYWIKKASEMGVTTVFSTGRGLPRVKHFMNELQLNAPMVLVNGGEVWRDYERVHSRYFLDNEHVRQLHQLAVEHGAHYWGYNLEAIVGPKSWTDEMFEVDWLKFGMSHKDDETMRYLWKTVEEWGIVEVTGKSHQSMEITVKGITKESGLREVCEFMDISMDEIIAVGDGPNDYEMIKAAGLGVAMGNADEEIKKVADVITDTNVNDGVAKVIQQYICGLSPQEVAQSSK